MWALGWQDQRSFVIRYPQRKSGPSLAPPTGGDQISELNQIDWFVKIIHNELKETSWWRPSPKAKEASRPGPFEEYPPLEWIGEADKAQTEVAARFGRTRPWFLRCNLEILMNS